jgi:hypothetical protein
MKKFIIPSILALLVIAVVVEGILIAASYDKINRSNANQDVMSAISVKGLSATSFNQPSISVSEGRTYFPEMKLFVTLDNVSSSLLYISREVGDPARVTDATYDIATRRFVSLSPVGYQQQKACYPVRLKFEDKPNAYSPYEQNSSSIKLEDGRTLQIYPNDDPACKPQFSTSATKPSEIKKVFEGAKSYE